MKTNLDISGYLEESEKIIKDAQYVNAIYKDINTKYPQAKAAFTLNESHYFYGNIIADYYPHNIKGSPNVTFFTDKKVEYNNVKICETAGLSETNYRNAIVLILVDKMNFNHLKTNLTEPVFSEIIVLATIDKYVTNNSKFSYHLHRVNNCFHSSEAAKEQTYNFCKSKVIQWIATRQASAQESSLTSLPPEVIEQVKNSKILL